MCFLPGSRYLKPVETKTYLFRNGPIGGGWGFGTSALSCSPFGLLLRNLIQVTIFWIYSKEYGFWILVSEFIFLTATQFVTGVLGA